MAIQFLHDHSVGEGDDRESFKEGQTVTDRSPESELAFVRRGHAGFVCGGKLFDHEDREISGVSAKRAKAPAGSRRGRERAGVARSVTGQRPAAVKKAKAAPKKPASKAGGRRKGKSAPAAVQTTAG